MRNGVDIVEIKRIERAYERNGDAFLMRFCSPEELDYCRSGTKGYRMASVAACYAAKEAMAKALGSGIAQGVSLLDIQVRHDACGAPYYMLSGAALRRFADQGLSGHSLSLSHDGGIALAFCLLW